jgi:choline dehydrogenase-like flavoprotein
MKKYDVVIVGAGAGGGVAAGVLSEAGKNVLLLERGQSLDFKEIGRDHLRNQRLSQYAASVGPPLVGNPRVMVYPNGERHVVDPTGAYQNNAATVGSGTRVYGGMAWRFLPDDFRMATKYGIPDGSSLSDWPVTYEDLAPSYARAEVQIGVSGDATTEGRVCPEREQYPMPPVQMNTQGRTLQNGAKSLGWETQRIPVLINSVPRDGRPACAACQHCVGFACPVEAKNGTRNTMIARAIATGNCVLETEVMAERIDTDSAGKVTGLTYFDRSGERVSVQADVVIVSGGAIETARLLLNSKSDKHPLGLGNASDQVGRNLQGHYYAGAMGFTPEPVWDGIGPGVTTATLDFNHDNSGVIGGGLLADDFVMLPIVFLKRGVNAGVPNWGIKHKEWMHDNYRRMLFVTGPVHEIPSPNARITIDPDVRDRWGIPVVRMSGTTHPETLRTFNYMNTKAEEWLKASGAEKIVKNQGGLWLSGGQHQAGTCRMGEDPKTSVTDTWGKVHGHDNLYIADGSLHVTNGGFNPVLTIYALAFRVADQLAKAW